MKYFNFKLVQPFHKNICYDVEKKQLLQNLKKINVYCVIYGTADYEQTYFFQFLAETKARSTDALKDYINSVLINSNWKLDNLEVKEK